MAKTSKKPKDGGTTATTTAAQTPWFDERTHAPLIASYTQRLDSFLSTMADGVVDQRELAAQEARLVKLMQEVEPQLPPPLHAKVTELLCELTAYDLMRSLHAMQDARPKTQFRG
jgi:hypothetical protein